MKLLFKLALLAMAAKMFVALPHGTSKELDKVGDLTVRQVASGLAGACQKVEKTLSAAFADAASEPKARHEHGGPGHHRANSRQNQDPEA